MNYHFLLFVGVMAAAAALVAPVVTNACGTNCGSPCTNPCLSGNSSAWSTVSVKQSQFAWSPHHQVDLQQSATINASVKLGDQASASSKTSGTQQLWVTGKGQQTQELTAGAGLTWQNAWPSLATARTTGSVDQSQSAWSNRPIMLKQDAGIWQKSRVGDTVSSNDAGTWQSNLGAVGDATQNQWIGGATQAQGFVNPPVPSCRTWLCGSTSGFGGRLQTVVEVLVQNILTF